MSVALLLITHDTIGSSLLETAISMLGICPIATENLPITQHCNPDNMILRAERLCDEIDQGNGVLILTDMYGSTPSNIALKLLPHNANNNNRVVITGINLPMLVRVMNYPQLPLDELVEKAISGGYESIFSLDMSNHCPSSFD